MKKIAKYGNINDVLYEWYLKCCQAGIYPDELNDSNLRDFEASNRQLKHFKKRSCLRQTRIVGEAGDAPITTIKAWMEQLPEVIQGFSADNIWNMDESGLFFKALSGTELANKTKKCKSGRKSKERRSVAFFVSSSGFKLFKPVVNGKGKVPRCFPKLPNPSKPYAMRYYHSKKAWVTT